MDPQQPPLAAPQSRLVLTVADKFVKIWDDRKTHCQPFDVAFFRPVPPEPMYHILGDIAIRSQDSSPPAGYAALVVYEQQVPGAIPLLAHPVEYVSHDLRKI